MSRTVVTLIGGTLLGIAWWSVGGEAWSGFAVGAGVALIAIGMQRGESA